MDTLKAILNQILLFFDAVGERFRRLPARGRRRVFLLALIFLLLVFLLAVLCISSCRRDASKTVAEAMDLNARTRVRGTLEAEEESSVRVSSDAYPIMTESEPLVETTQATWVPEQSESWTEPEDDPLDEPEDDPLDEPEATPEPTFDPEEEPTPEPTAEPEDEPEATPEPESTPQYATLKKHDKSDEVTTLQYRLMEQR